MKKTRSNSQLYQYLQDHSVDFSDTEAVALLKKEFYKKYDRTLKQRKRQEHRVITITIPTTLIHHVRARSREQGSTIPTYIKRLMTADCRDTTLFEQTNLYREVILQLQMCSNSLDTLIEKDSTRWFKNTHYDELKKALQNIRQLVEIKKK
ncbi:MAG: hypothetical protein K1X55_13195 [Chitinophagales bacterium]|nr:hypothetical protein [Chitinophagales bacterium]